MDLSIGELVELEENILAEIPDKITEILNRANRYGRIPELLEMMGMSYLLQPSQKAISYREGNIAVLGGSDVKKKVLLSIARQLGIDSNRLEFCLDYNRVQKYEYQKLQYTPQYRVVLIGPMPYSTNGKVIVAV